MHWIQNAAINAGIEGAHALYFFEASNDEAWHTAASVLGLAAPQLTPRLAAGLRLGVADFTVISAHTRRLIPERTARKYGVVPLREDDRRLVVATADPCNVECEQAIEFASGRRVVFELAAPEQVAAALNAVYGGDPMPIPLAAIETPSAVVQAPVAAPAIVPDAPTILVVDDDPIERLYVGEILRAQGFRVAEANDGRVALEQLESGQACSLLLTDLQMKDMDGDELLERVRQHPRSARLPVVVLTGVTDGSREVQLLDAGADDYIRKPLDAPRMVARIRGALRRAAA